MTIKNKAFALILSLFVPTVLSAQEPVAGYIYKQPDGKMLINAYIDAKGDTIIYVELREIEVKAPRTFASADDYKRWERYKRLAPSVVPYALRTVKTYRAMEAATRDGSSRDRKKYIKSHGTIAHRQYAIAEPNGTFGARWLKYLRLCGKWT